MKIRPFALTLLALLAAALPLSAQTQICVPQFADGVSGQYRWGTTLIFQNPGATPAQTQFQFYGPAGQQLMLMMNRRGGGPFQPGPGGMFSMGPFNGGAMAAYRSGGAGPLQTGFCIIDSSGRIQVQVMLHLHDLFGNLMSETGITPSGPFTSGSIYVDHTENARVGLALANPSTTAPASVLLEVFAQDGTTSLASTSIQLGPRTHFSRFVDELFPNPLVDTVGYIRITSSSPVCGMAIRIQGTTLSAIPPFIN